MGPFPTTDDRRSFGGRQVRGSESLAAWRDLNKFYQNPVRSFGMDKGDAGAIRRGVHGSQFTVHRLAGTRHFNQFDQDSVRTLRMEECNLRPLPPVTGSTIEEGDPC